MLHTLNDAWARILINQVIKDTHKKFLFICENMKEVEKYIDMVVDMDEEKVLYVGNIFIITIKDAETWVTFMKKYPRKHEMIMYDDILISHELHDPMIKNILGQHCRRKGA